jgi:hypothetical protein
MFRPVEDVSLRFQVVGKQSFIIILLKALKPHKSPSPEINTEKEFAIHA